MGWERSEEIGLTTKVTNYLEAVDPSSNEREGGGEGRERKRREEQSPMKFVQNTGEEKRRRRRRRREGERGCWCGRLGSRPVNLTKLTWIDYSNRMIDLYLN